VLWDSVGVAYVVKTWSARRRGVVRLGVDVLCGKDADQQHAGSLHGLLVHSVDAARMAPGRGYTRRRPPRASSLAPAPAWRGHGVSRSLSVASSSARHRCSGVGDFVSMPSRGASVPAARRHGRSTLGSAPDTDGPNSSSPSSLLTGMARDLGKILRAAVQGTGATGGLSTRARAVLIVVKDMMQGRNCPAAIHGVQSSGTMRMASGGSVLGLGGAAQG
jgi:hypothetical protein